MARAVRRRLDGSQILLANQTMEKASRLAEELDAMAVDNHAVAREADYIFLGVKPQVMEDMLKKIAPVLALRGKSFTSAGSGCLKISPTTAPLPKACPCAVRAG